MTAKNNLIAATVGLLISVALPAVAGGPSITNETIVASTSIASSGSVTTIISGGSGGAVLTLTAPPPGETATVEVNGQTVEVSQDSSGNVLVNGQPLVVNGLPNLGLLISIGYS